MNDTPPAWVAGLEARLSDLVIRLVLLGIFVYWSLALVRPFLPIALWAVVLAVALAPVHASLARRLGGRRALAAALLTVVALAVVIGPVATLTGGFVESVHNLVTRAEAGELRLPVPPPRLGMLPVVGAPLHDFWILASTNIEAVLVRYRDVLAPIGVGLLSFLSAVSFDLLRLLMAIVVSGVLLFHGPGLARGGRRIAQRIVPPRGGQFVDLAGATIRNVSRGVVGVAALQSLLIGIVLYIAGVPGAGLLAFAILVLCLVQVGPMLIVLPVLAWAWLTMPTGPALVLTLVLAPLALMDNVLKPMLMGRGLSTPTLVVFLGVVGGTLGFGLLGLFLGPVVLAVFYDLLVSWARLDATPEPAPDDPFQA